MTTGERVPAAKVVEPVLRGLKVLRCRLGVAGGVGGVGGVGAVGAAHISRRTPRSRPAGSLAAAEPGAAGLTRGRRARARRRPAGTRAASSLGASATLPTLEADIVAGASAGDAPPARRASRLRGPPASTEYHGHDWRGRRGADRETRAVGRRTRGEGETSRCSAGASAAAARASLAAALECDGSTAVALSGTADERQAAAPQRDAHVAGGATSGYMTGDAHAASRTVRTSRARRLRTSELV